MKKRHLRNSHINNHSRFVSLKTNSIQTTESLLEFDACFHFEFATDIVSFEAQPLGYEYQLDDEIRKYTSDFSCKFTNNDSIYFEVKPKVKTLSDEFQKKFRAKKNTALQMGKDLELITDEEIRIYPLLDNLKIIHRYACLDPPDNLQIQILDIFKTCGQLKIGQVLIKAEQSSAIVLPALYDLIAKRLLSINWHKPINENTLVKITNENS